MLLLSPAIYHVLVVAWTSGNSPASWLPGSRENPGILTVGSPGAVTGIYEYTHRQMHRLTNYDRLPRPESGQRRQQTFEIVLNSRSDLATISGVG